MKQLILFLTLILSSTIYAALFEQSFKFESYKEAKNSNNKLTFSAESTKMGFITTSFDGAVKEFRVRGDLSDKKFTAINVSFPTESLDTDVDARNEKMWDLCLSSKSYPEILVMIPEADFSSGNDIEVPAQMNIRGKSHTIKLNLKLEEEGGSFKISGKSETGFAELEIPDPSILIAKVKNPIWINFSLTLSKP